MSSRLAACLLLPAPPPTNLWLLLLHYTRTLTACLLRQPTAFHFLPLLHFACTRDCGDDLPLHARLKPTLAPHLRLSSIVLIYRLRLAPPPVVAIPHLTIDPPELQHACLLFSTNLSSPIQTTISTLWRLQHITQSVSICRPSPPGKPKLTSNRQP
jgi:hypothetical protein